MWGCGANGSDGLLKCSINDKAKQAEWRRGVLALKSSDSNKNSLPLSHSAALSFCLSGQCNDTTQDEQERGDIQSLTFAFNAIVSLINLFDNMTWHSLPHTQLILAVNNAHTHTHIYTHKATQSL